MIQKGQFMSAKARDNRATHAKLRNVNYQEYVDISECTQHGFFNRTAIDNRFGSAMKTLTYRILS